VGSRFVLGSAILASSLLAASAHALTCDRAPDVTALADTAIKRGHDTRFAPLIRQIDASLNAQPFDILAFGDSIMQQWPADQLSSVAPGRSILNAGIPGDSAAALLYRLSGRTMAINERGTRSEVGFTGLGRQKPRAVVVHIGTNSLLRGEACDTFWTIRAVLDKLQSLYPQAHVVVTSVLPRGESMRQFEEEIRDINALVSGYIRTTRGRVSFLDLHEQFRCANRTPCALMRPPTHVHLTPEGYSIYARALAAHLRSLRIT
jgi:lysophospholipase L1-like esterase